MRLASIDAPADRPVPSDAGRTPRPYRRRDPEHTLLHAAVRARLEPFLAAARERSPSGRGLPAFVEQALRAYLACGVLAHGFARIRCPGCGFERLVAFSCKVQVCPSCAARRMEDASDHLAHDVFPEVPVRQWVLSFPRSIRFLAARQPEVLSRLLDLFTRAVFAWQRRRARALRVADPRTGGCTAVQRFGGALNLNVHFHTLVPDGVFELHPDGGPAEFVYLDPPSDEDVRAVLARVVRRTAKLLAGLDDLDPGAEEDALAALQAAEVDRRTRFPDPFPYARRSAQLDGFSLHAGVRVHANDRDGLERLCRYALRPPLAVHRLSHAPDGRLVYRMKRPRGGSLLLVLTQDELLARLASLVPPPRTHALRYHGVFAPNSSVRSRVVPARPVTPVTLADRAPQPEREAPGCHPHPDPLREPSASSPSSPSPTSPGRSSSTSASAPRLLPSLPPAGPTPTSWTRSPTTTSQRPPPDLAVSPGRPGACPPSPLAPVPGALAGTEPPRRPAESYYAARGFRGELRV